MRWLLAGLCGLSLLGSSAVRGDILLYPLPGTNAAFALQGKVSPNPGGTVTFRHSRFGNLYFDLNNVRYYEVPTTRAIAQNRRQRWY